MTFTTLGLTVISAQDALTTAQNIFISAYGENIDLNPSAPTGLLIQQVADAIMTASSNITSLYSSINPYLATGIELDAICSNLNTYRIPATYTTAAITVTGLSGTIIPAGKQVISTNQDVFLIQSQITIASDGTGTGTVVAKESGVVPALANTINSILQGINGWDTINNPANGTIGQVVENDYSLRSRFLASQAASSTGSMQALNAAFLALKVPFKLLENKEDTSQTIQGVTVTPHSVSLWIVDDGSLDTRIATIFYEKLSAGCNMNGLVTYNLAIPNTSPVEYFTARFQRAQPVNFTINVVLASGYLYSPNVATDILTIINDNWSYTTLGDPIFATTFVRMLEDNGIAPIQSLTMTSGTDVDVNVLTLPINQHIVIPLVSSNIVVNVV